MANGDYVFKHAEADTMLLSAYAKLRAGNCTRTVVIDSTDTDVYVQATYVSHSLRGDLMIKRKHAQVNCRAMMTDEIASIIIPLHVISGSDHTSAFCGYGKKKLLAKVAEDPQARELLEQVGDWSWMTRLEIRWRNLSSLTSMAEVVMWLVGRREHLNGTN